MANYRRIAHPKRTFFSADKIRLSDKPRKRARGYVPGAFFSALAEASRASGYTPDAARSVALPPDPLQSADGAIIFTKGMRYMNTRKFAFRIKERDYQMLKAKAKRGKVTMTSLIVSAITGKEIIVIDDLKNFLSELKAIGRNLNQLTTLANMGKVNTVYLTETKQELNRLYEMLAAVTEVKSNGDG